MIAPLVSTHAERVLTNGIFVFMKFSIYSKVFSFNFEPADAIYFMLLGIILFFLKVSRKEGVETKTAKRGQILSLLVAPSN